jgi:hypothetical protein
MNVALQLLLGAVSCGIFIFLARRFGPKQELRLYALSLIIAALIYVVFAALDPKIEWLMLELAGVLVFAVLALLGLKVSALILAFGWALHAGWDVLLHKLPHVAFVPDWYPLVCLSFDLVLAIYIAARVKASAFKRA